MKTRNHRAIGLLAATSLAFLLSETNANDDAGLLLRSKQKEFADALTTALHTNANDCTSAWGVSMLFGLLYPGGADADEATTKVRETFGFPENRDEIPWNATASLMGAKYNGAREWYQLLGMFGDKAPTLEVANSVWVDDATDLTTTYEEAVGEYVMETDFKGNNAGDVINEWVSDSTNGLIDKIINEGPIPFDLVAINSIYLNASWYVPFSEYSTNEDLFHQDTASATNAHFMHKVENLPYSHKALDGFQLVQLRYARSSLSMIIALPVGESKTTTSSDVLASLPNLEMTRVALAMPKFKFQSEYEDELKSALASLGLDAAFDPMKGFCGMHQEGCAYIDLIKQKTYIDVHEKGTEAAAVTGGLLETTSLHPPPADPVEFMADHPFQFFVYDRIEDLVLFEGQVGNPGIADDALTPKLAAKHSDDDFWTKNFGVGQLVMPDNIFNPFGSSTPEHSSSGKLDLSDFKPGSHNDEMSASSNLLGAAPQALLSLIIMLYFFI
mmetsp:Transcript_25300/g.51682  ORF Transcript_25300/g.51682 Transcript_25300/m.51682 type:complete len:500 (-) Transcript_25300:476-1975(-)